MIRASERRIRVIRTAEVAEGAPVGGGPGAEDTGGVAVEWEAAKVMMSARKCMNS